MERPKNSRWERQGKGFTLIELLAVIAIIAILAAILFPVFARARENARRASCMSNVKQVALGMMQYTQDYDEKIPPLYNYGYAGGGINYWPYLIMPYLKSSQIFDCPSASDSVYTGWHSDVIVDYGANTRLFNATQYGGPSMDGMALAAINQPSTTVMITDSLNSTLVNPKGWGLAGYDVAAYYPQYRHLETTNVGFFDGHAKTMRKDALELKATTEDGQTLTGDEQFVLWNQY